MPCGNPFDRDLYRWSNCLFCLRSRLTVAREMRWVSAISLMLWPRARCWRTATRSISSGRRRCVFPQAGRGALVLRGNINNDVSSPETVNDLLAHYRKYELTPARKVFASIENRLTLSKCYITPRWATYKLGAVRTVQVEEWLDSLPLAPASKTKTKSAFCLVQPCDTSRVGLSKPDH